MMGARQPLGHRHGGQQDAAPSPGIVPPTGERPAAAVPPGRRPAVHERPHRRGPHPRLGRRRRVAGPGVLPAGLLSRRLAVGAGGSGAAARGSGYHRSPAQTARRAEAAGLPFPAGCSVPELGPRRWGWPSAAPLYRATSGLCPSVPLVFTYTVRGGACAYRVCSGSNRAGAAADSPRCAAGAGVRPSPRRSSGGTAGRCGIV
jgi:hypothetical protein